MAILIRNAYVFAPKDLGATDVLMVGLGITTVFIHVCLSLFLEFAKEVFLVSIKLVRNLAQSAILFLGRNG